jgi:hypothetical protein
MSSETHHETSYDKAWDRASGLAPPNPEWSPSQREWFEFLDTFVKRCYDDRGGMVVRMGRIQQILVEYPECDEGVSSPGSLGFEPYEYLFPKSYILLVDKLILVFLKWNTDDGRDKKKTMEYARDLYPLYKIMEHHPILGTRLRATWLNN